MHECSTCGTACDCSGDDLWEPEPDEHECINPNCGEDPDAVDDLSHEALDAELDEALEKDD